MAAERTTPGVSPRVTVLIAAHNGGSALHEAVRSVLAQTYTDFELLLVDDASTDDAVCTLPDDPRIRVIANKHNAGQIPSLNRGLREARGEFVARLDHDDLCLPTRLESQVELLDRSPETALAATWFDIVDERNRRWARVRPRMETFADFAAGILVDRLPLAHPTLMFRHSVVLHLGGFDETLGAAEDKDLYRRLVLGRHEARVVPEVLVLYRRHEAQMTYAKAGMVRENDAHSQESFYRQLAPDLAPRPLRLLFGSSPHYWDGPRAESTDAESFLEQVKARLELSSPEYSVVAGALAGGVARTIRSGWSEARRDYATDARTLASFVHAHADVRERALTLIVIPLAVTTHPVARFVPKVRRMLWRVLRLPAVGAIRRLAARSRVLRELYSLLLGPRLLRR